MAFILGGVIIAVIFLIFLLYMLFYHQKKIGPWLKGGIIVGILFTIILIFFYIGFAWFSDNPGIIYWSRALWEGPGLLFMVCSPFILIYLILLGIIVFAKFMSLIRRKKR